MQGIAQEIVTKFGSQEKFRQAIVENPIDVILTVVPIGEALKTVEVSNLAGK